MLRSCSTMGKDSAQDGAGIEDRLSLRSHTRGAACARCARLTPSGQRRPVLDRRACISTFPHNPGGDTPWRAIRSASDHSLPGWLQQTNPRSSELQNPAESQMATLPSCFVLRNYFARTTRFWWSGGYERSFGVGARGAAAATRAEARAPPRATRARGDMNTGRERGPSVSSRGCSHGPSHTARRLQVITDRRW